MKHPDLLAEKRDDQTSREEGKTWPLQSQQPMYVSFLQMLTNFIAIQSLASSKSSSFHNKFTAKKEMEEFILEENKSRCDFFKYYSYDTSDQCGVVSTTYNAIRAMVYNY